MSSDEERSGQKWTEKCPLYLAVRRTLVPLTRALEWHAGAGSQEAGVSSHDRNSSCLAATISIPFAVPGAASF